MTGMIMCSLCFITGDGWKADSQQTRKCGQMSPVIILLAQMWDVL